MRLRFVALSSCFLAVALSAGAQQPTAERVRAIAPPATPLPAEQDSRDVTRFSFIVYGDTRGRRDGLDVQYEHSLVVDSMLARIKQLALTPYPARFVLQSGDAVLNGRDPRQWNVSFTPLIDRLTKDGNVPYFLAPGNHDLTSAPTADSPERQIGLRNFFDAVSALVPRDGTPRLRLVRAEPLPLEPELPRRLSCSPPRRADQRRTARGGRTRSRSRSGRGPALRAGL